ncbi:MAG TPA: prolyl oligopeptidase family serine peptidase [Pseudonocardiaceae bacterium]
MSDSPEQDPYLWLEDVTGDAALDWVRARNAESTAELAGSEHYRTLYAELLEVLDSDDRIPYPRQRGAHLYNFWQDAANPRGLWRRTSRDSYRTHDPEWEVLLDLDALADAEGENWVWNGASVLPPDHRLALVELSRGGADAGVVREFDLDRREFVGADAGGFTLPEAKTRIGWIDADRVHVGTDLGEGSLTTSGYPRVLKEWRRGTPVADAPTVFEAKPGDVSAFYVQDHTPGYRRALVGRSPGFFTSETYLRPDGSDELIRLDVPDDAVVDMHHQWFTVHPRSDWTTGDTTWPAGSLLVIELDAFLRGDRNLTMVFEPDERTSLSGFTWTRGHLLVSTLSDVISRIHVHTPGPGGWTSAPLPGVPDVGAADIIGTDPLQGDEYILEYSGFTEPATVAIGVIGEGDPEPVKRSPAFFDATGVRVEQFFTTSDDGTRVPYFVIGRRDEPAPTILHGYGGFEVSKTPAYSGLIGRGWIARGGVYVVANIRGGGEYGPAWHNAALRENRPRAYQDFAAVARDLVARGITTVAQLGTEGGSNGGLLTGNMLTLYPELFGAVVSQVPLLDMRRYHLLLAGASWMAEWGDPDDPDDWAYLRGYSPYHNLDPGRTYPPTLLMTSTRDDRVHPGHARKMAALMAGHGMDVRYYENIEGGHGGATNNHQRATKMALVLEFFWRTLGGPDA